MSSMVAETHFYGPHLGHRAAMTIGQDHFSALKLTQAQLDCQMFRDAEMYGSTVG
jgi:hypothetical protein